MLKQFFMYLNENIILYIFGIETNIKLTHDKFRNKHIYTHFTIPLRIALLYFKKYFFWSLCQSILLCMVAMHEEKATVNI